MQKPNKDWSDYYKITKERPPSQLLVRALEYVSIKNKAIDIGAGALKDTRYLLENGFDVTTIDESPLITQMARVLDNNKVHVFVTPFEEFDFPINEYDIGSAMFALPFTAPDRFKQTFIKIKNSINVGGILCAHFFGKNDEWSKNPKMTFHTKYQIREMFVDFEILYIQEIEKDSTTADGTPKHWHFFEVIARK